MSAARPSRFWKPGLLALLPVLLVVEDPRLPVDDPTWTDRYDVHFRKYAKRYFGPLDDWRWFRAQGIAESGLREHAVSRAGARGIMQLMPATFAQVARDAEFPSDIHNARWNIAAGILYDAHLYGRFSAPRSTHRRALMLAAYNAGPRKIRNAQAQARRRGVNPEDWTALARHTPRATRRYVERVFQLMGQQLDTGAPG